jgi:NAD-dependent deacetylase
MLDKLQQLAAIIKTSNNIVAFTGAGVSTESNIPDFRSPNGLYNRRKYDYPPETIISRSFFMEHPDIFFDFYKSQMVYKEAQPNDCHKALARLEQLGKLKAVITQNIDGLHQKVGSRIVLELHGTIYSNHCMNCGKFFDLDYVLNTPGVPLCDKCGGIVKPDVVLYEEPLDSNTLAEAVRYISKADVMLVMGTSLVVYPAAGLIDYYSGDKLVLINKTSTPYDFRANIIIHDSVGETMRSVMQMVDI